MLDNTVDVLIQKIKDEVITDPNIQEIPLAYLMTRNIPASVKHFFDQEVETLDSRRRGKVYFQ